MASYTLAFALQPRRKHGKTSVRVAASKVRVVASKVRVAASKVRVAAPKVRVATSKVQRLKNCVEENRIYHGFAPLKTRCT